MALPFLFISNPIFQSVLPVWIEDLMESSEPKLEPPSSCGPIAANYPLFPDSLKCFNLILIDWIPNMISTENLRFPKPALIAGGKRDSALLNYENWIREIPEFIISFFLQTLRSFPNLVSPPDDFPSLLLLQHPLYRLPVMIAAALANRFIAFLWDTLMGKGKKVLSADKL